MKGVDHDLHVWNIWNERNRRTFDEVSFPSPTRVPQLIKDEMAARAAACEFQELPISS
jgi:hypothetical protein